MRRRLKLAGSGLSPEAALVDLRRIQRRTVRIDTGKPVHGVQCRFTDAEFGEPRGIGEIALPQVAPAVANAGAGLGGRQPRAPPCNGA